jgi:hypothetical protein
MRGYMDPEGTIPFAAGAFRSCRIFKRTWAGFPMIFVYLSAPHGSFSESDILAGFSGDTANSLYSSLVDDIGEGTDWTPTTSFVAGNDAVDIAPGNWFHLFLSIDFSSKDGWIIIPHDDDAAERWDDPDNAKRVWFLINGQDFGIGGPAEVEFEGDVLPTNGYCRSQITSVEGRSISNSFNYDVLPEGVGVAKFEIPPWSLAINGNEFALPCVSENAAGGVNPSIRYGDVQIWVDQYIDASNADNLAKFRDADGKPVNPSIAAAAFGAPTYLIRGPASAIETNGGTGGDFVKTGTVIDATPGP